MPKGIPRTQKEHETRRREIALTAADLIFEKGFNETSVRQIAKAAGIGKSTLYDFFSTKDEIILYLMEDILGEITEKALAITTGGGSPLDLLYRVMRMHQGFLLDNRAFILKLTLEAQRLSLENQRLIQVNRYAYQDLVAELIRTGIEAGEFRQIDHFVAMKTLFAMLSAVVFTTRPAGTPEEMLDQAMDLVLKGMRA